MKKLSGILFFLLLLISSQLTAQVENVRVETYYISDSNDSTDTDGGGLPEHSKTYRIYIDLVAGSKLTKIYGDENHALKISSTEIFFNNIADGQTYGYLFPKNRLQENTVALDTWLTLGQTTKYYPTKTYFGVLKPTDDDGSFIGGTNNDGGSAGISTGLLINNDPEAGIPLTIADGMDTMVLIPSNWGSYGIDSSGLDTTIFGSVKTGNQFISNNAWLQNSGVTGVNTDSNLVLVAQLTTLGEISFELNVEVIDTSGHTVKYVANDSVLLTGEVICRNLKYPFTQVCGCPDPHYLEYIADRDCDSQDSCHSLIVFGCMDTMACNYNPDANFNVQSLCCYPGYCNDRDISVVCPSLNYERHRFLQFNLFPNPAHDMLTFQSPAYMDSEIRYSIYNSLGEVVQERNIGNAFYPVNLDLNISLLHSGIYLFRIEAGGKSDIAKFIKN